MLLAVRHLLDRTRHPRARADALLQLRKRLLALPLEPPLDELRELATRLADLREQLSAALGEVSSCSKCAVGHPEPYGHWSGGQCCGGETEKVFSDVELAALQLSGTQIGDLRPPDSDLAGCTFRGPTGCSLSLQHRPTICVRYICRQLEFELRQRGDLKHVRVLQEQLAATFRAFEQLYGEHVAQTQLGAPDAG